MPTPIQDPLAAIRALEEEHFGFWNATPQAGVWRSVACHRRGGAPGPQGESASAISWSNAEAMELVRALLGLPPGPVPEFVDPGACLKILAEGLAMWSSGTFGPGWASASASEPSGLSGSGTARFLAFGEGELLGLAAGMELASAAWGGSVRHSSPELASRAKAMAAEAAAKPGHEPWRPADFVRVRMEVDGEADLFAAPDPASGLEHSFDSRACARALGMPVHASLCQPWLGDGFSPKPSSFLRGPALRQAFFKAFGARAGSIGCSVPWDSEGPEAAPVAAHRAMQDAELLRASLGPAAASASPKRSL